MACCDVPGDVNGGKKARGKHTVGLLCHATSITLHKEGRFGKNASCECRSDGINLSSKYSSPGGGKRVGSRTAC